MKRFISMLIITILLLTATACNRTGETGAAAQDPDGETVGVTAEAAGQNPAGVTPGAESAGQNPAGVTPGAEAHGTDGESDGTGGTQQASGAVRLHTEAQTAYLAGNYKLFKSYANGTDELSRPQPVVIAVPEGMGDDTVLILTGDDGEKTYRAESGSFTVYNLMIGTTYSYVIEEAVSVQDGSTGGDASGGLIGSGLSDVLRVSGSFTTEDVAPRNIHVPGITNVRDIGGWKLENGGTVRQGLIFRSAKFNPDDSPELLATDEGLSVLLDDLGIRTEIDLRGADETGGISESPLGGSVKYCPVPFASGGNIILLNKDKLPELFAILGDEANYPIVFHCSIGTDRTGMVAFLINGLLGVSEDDLYTDFLFSNFGEIGKLRTPSIIDTYIQTVDMAQGDNLSEKIYNYLTGSGVDPEDIETLVSVLTGGKEAE